MTEPLTKSVYKGIRIPRHIASQIDAYAEKYSLNTSQAIIKLLSLGLRRREERGADYDDVLTIKKDVRAICEKLGITQTISSTEPAVLYGICDAYRSSIVNAFQCYAWFFSESMAVSCVEQLNQKHDEYKVIERDLVLALA